MLINVSGLAFPHHLKMELLVKFERLKRSLIFLIEYMCIKRQYLYVRDSREENYNGKILAILLSTFFYVSLCFENYIVRILFVFTKKINTNF